MSRENIIFQDWEPNGTYCVTFSVNHGTSTRNYWYDRRAGAAIELGADPTGFPPIEHDSGGAGGTGIRAAKQFNRAVADLKSASVGEASEALSGFDAAVSSISSAAMEAAGSAGLLL